VSALQRVVILRSNPVAPDPRVEKTARALSRGGYGVHVLAWDRSNILPGLERREGYHVERFRLPAPYGSGLGNLRRLLRWQAFLMSWLARNRDHYDILHACDFDTVIPARVMQALAGKKLVYDIFDFYADHIRSTPGWIREGIRHVDYGIVHRADGVILVDDVRREQVEPANPRKVEVIYNTPEDCLVEMPTSMAQKYGLRIAYVGLLVRERGLFELMDVLSANPLWQLDLAGFGGDEEEILARAKMLPNVTWHGRLVYEDALRLSANADVLLATYNPQVPNHRYASPNKVYEAMMLGKPVLVARDTHVDQMIEKDDCGLVVDYGDCAALRQALEKLEENPDYCRQLGLNARQAYQKFYSWKIMEERLLALYSRL